MIAVLRRWQAVVLDGSARLTKRAWATRVEHLQAVAVLVGWALFWWGLSDVLGRWLSPRGIQAIGLGLLILSSIGWKVLKLMATVGLYNLSKADKT